MDILSLFSAQDYENGKKGKKSGTGKGSKGGKKETAPKGVRYPLPVRVFSGHIRCLLETGEFGGKTVSESDIKKKIREKYPELAGVEFSLVKFSNSFTEQYEKDNGAVSKETGAESTGEELEKEQPVEEPLDFAAAESEAEEGSAEGLSEEEEEDVAEEKKENLPAKGCWVKLDICYQAVAEDENISIPVTVKAGEVSMEFTEETASSLADIRKGWAAVHPEYAGCLFHYDDKQDLLIPFVRGENEIKGKKYSLPVMVGYLDDMVTYTAQDFGDTDLQAVTQEQIRKLYALNHPEFDNAIFSYIEEPNCLSR